MQEHIIKKVVYVIFETQRTVQILEVTQIKICSFQIVEHDSFFYIDKASFLGHSKRSN